MTSRHVTSESLAVAELLAADGTSVLTFFDVFLLNLQISFILTNSQEVFLIWLRVLIVGAIVLIRLDDNLLDLLSIPLDIPTLTLELGLILTRVLLLTNF